MRILAVSCITIVTVLGGVWSATARIATPLEEHYSYAGCYCHFGYGTSGCSDAVACTSEGGLCARACVIPRQ